MWIDIIIVVGIYNFVYIFKNTRNGAKTIQVRYQKGYHILEGNSQQPIPTDMKWGFIVNVGKLGFSLLNASFIFSCDQAALQMVFSVRPSVRLSVCPSVRLSVTPLSPCSHHRIIMKFSGVITMVKSDVHAKGQGQRSKVKVTEVNTQLSRFRTLTPVWIHIWQWNHAHSW